MSTGNHAQRQVGRGPRHGPRHGPGHDHGACVTQALEMAREVCAREGARLTPLREQVLTIVWQSHRPSGAYDVLDKLAATHKSARPPTVYRALDFLLSLGLIHKIESLNAYLGCAQVGPAHDGVFLICRACGDAQELAGLPVETTLSKVVTDTGFKPEHRTIELTGLCAQCAP